nr:Ser3-L [Andraca theae]
MAWILYTAIVCMLISTSASEDSKSHPIRHIYGKDLNSAQKVHGPLVALGYLSKSVTDKCGNAGDIFLHLSKKKTATNLDELLGGLFEIVEATSEIVEGWIPELGKILKNMLISIVWVEACFPDSPLGKQLKGDLPAICAKEVSSHPGWEYFENGFDSPLYTISYYRLAGISDIIGQMLKSYGAGKNLDDLVGTPTIVGEAVVDIANVFKKDEMSWDLKVLSEVFAKFTTIIAALAENSYKSLGVHVVDGIHKFCSGIGKDFGLDISPHLSEIKDKISHSTCHTFENTLRKCVKNAKLNFDQFASAEDVTDDTNAAARIISNVMKAFDDNLNNDEDNSNDESKSTGNKNKIVSALFNVLRNFMRPNKDKSRDNRNKDESNTSKHSTERDVSFDDYDDLNVNFGPSNTDDPESSAQAFVDVDETISLFERNSDEDKKHGVKHSAPNHQPTAKSDDQINNKPIKLTDSNRSDKSTANLPADTKEFTDENIKTFETSTDVTLRENNEKYTTTQTNEYTEKPSVELPLVEQKEHTESNDKHKEKVIDETNNNNEHTKLSDNNGSDKSTTEKPDVNINNKPASESSEEDDNYTPFRFSLFPLLKGLMGSVATNNDKSDEIPETKPTLSDFRTLKDEILSESSTAKATDDITGKHKTSDADKNDKDSAKDIKKNDHLASNLHEPEGHTITETSTAKTIQETHETPTKLDEKNPQTNNTSNLPKDSKATETSAKVNNDSLSNEKKNKTSFIIINKDDTLPSVKLDKESSGESSNEKAAQLDPQHQSAESEEYMPWYTQDDVLLAKVIQEEEGPKPLASFGLFSSSVSKQCKKSPDLLMQLSRIESPKNFKEAMNGIFGVVRAVSGVIDAWVQDLGTVLSDMIMAIVKIESCVPHSKYINGVSGTPCVCEKDFGNTWDWEPFQGTYDHALNVTNAYALDRVWAKVSTLLEDHGKGKPLKDLAGTPAVLAQTIYQMSTIFRHASTWNHQVMTLAFVKFTTILGALGQSSGRPNLAETMVDEFIEYMSYIGKYYKIDLKPERSVIMTNIGKCTNNTLGGAILLGDDNENGGEITSIVKENTNKGTSSEAKNRKPKSISDNIVDDNIIDQTVKPRKNDTKRIHVSTELTDDEVPKDDKQNDEEPRADNIKYGDNSPPHGIITILNQSYENPTNHKEVAYEHDSLEHIPFGKENSETNDKSVTQNNGIGPAVREETKITSNDQVSSPNEQKSKVEPTTANQNEGNNIDTDCSEEKDNDKAKEKNALSKDNKNSKKNGLSLYQLLSNMFKRDDESDESYERITTPATIEDQGKARNDNTVSGSTEKRLKKQSKRDVDDILKRQTDTPFWYDTQMIPNYEKDVDNNTEELPENYINNRIDVEVGSGDYSTSSPVPTEKAEAPFMAVGFVVRGTSDKNMNWDDFLHSFFSDFLKTAVNQQPSDATTVIKA